MRHPEADRLARDTTALVRVVTPGDFPRGIAVVADRVGGRVEGLSIGNGNGLAGFYGRRDVAHVVIVDVDRILAGAAVPTAAHRAHVDCVALHEVAHALFGMTTTPDVAGDVLVGAARKVETHTAHTAATQHDVRWAAAYMLLAKRAAGFRVYGAAVLELVRASVARYGFPPAELERVCRGVAADASLAELLADDGPAAVLLDNVLPGVDARMAAAVAAGVVVAGITGVSHGQAETGRAI